MGLVFSTIENSTFNTRPWKFNKSYWSSFEMYPEWASRSYYVFKGIAHHEREYWTGTMVAVKTFRHKTGNNESWEKYIHRCDLARKISAEFNKLLDSNSCDIRVNFVKPIEAMMENRSDIMKITRFLMRFDKKFADKEVVLFEDLLEGEFNLFVTSNGSTKQNGSEVLDAFCHYCYHTSGGSLVICNLKGIEEDGRYKLTNPTVHSLSGCYGDNDQSMSGITTFFNNHICNAMCEQYLKPEFVSGTPSASAVSYMDATHSKLCDNQSEEAEHELVSPPRYTTIYPDGPPLTIARELNTGAL